VTTDYSIAGLSWSSGLIGVEPLPESTFDVPLPDVAAIKQQSSRELQALQARRLHADAVVRRLGPAVRMGLFATATGVVLAIALLVGIASRGPSAFYDGVEKEHGGAYRVLAYALLTGPFIGTAAFSTWSKLRGPFDRTTGKTLTVLCVAAIAAGVVTFGAGWVALPLVMGPLLLWRRPLIMMPDQSFLQVDPSVLGAYRAARRDRAAAKHAVAQLPTEEERLEKAISLHELQFLTFELDRSRRWPFAPVGPLSDQDLLVVGGEAAERGDLVHNLTGAWSLAGPVWIIDLRDDGDAGAAVTGARENGRTIGWIDGTRADGIVALLDELGRTSKGSSALIEVLSAGMATDAASGSVARARAITDTLRRIGSVLTAERDDVRVVDFHEAMEAILGGATAASSVPDDFGLGGSGDAPARDHLSPDETSRLRRTFDDQDKESLYELRTKLAALLPERADRPAQIAWGPGYDVSVASVSSSMSRSDRELRTALLLEHHIQMLRQEDTDLPACLIALGCDDAPKDTLRELSSVAKYSGVALVLVFAERTDVLLELGEGRRALAAFGGLGSTAAEKLSDAFGRDWRWRVQSYQANWSASTANSRTRTSGRSWQWSESKGTQEGVSQGSNVTHSDGKVATSESEQLSSGTSQSFQRGEGSTVSVADGITDQKGTGRGKGEVREYEQAVRGAELARLPPFTMLLRIASGEVKYVDVRARAVVPEVGLPTVQRIEVRRRPAGRPEPSPASLTRPPLLELPPP
jgi:hypothetical protein